MKSRTFLKAFTLENFKAVQKSGAVQFTPLTVLIGNNGSGKSSLVEGLETYRSIVVEGLDWAMQRWFGMDHIWNKRVRHKVKGLGLTNEIYENPIRFTLAGRTRAGAYRTTMAVNAKPGLNGFLIQEEEVTSDDGTRFTRDRDGVVMFADKSSRQMSRLGRFEPGYSALPQKMLEFVSRWQFLSLLPDPMGRPAPKKMTSNGEMVLHRDGSNLAQYLLGIRQRDAAAFDGIVEAMQFVLDYARNFEPVETREIQPTMYLKMLEEATDKAIEIPGWLISTGTIRVLALLAVLRNPEPPPLLIVEEIENGLDPRTIHLVLDEIRSAVQDGQSQVILTTHSPYLLDLLPIQTLVLVEREHGGDPIFWRPASNKEVLEWTANFAPGQLYTKGRFRREVKP
jgi:predicted ATPase